mgnify:FL=1
MLGYLGGVLGHVGAILEAILRYIGASWGVWGGVKVFKNLVKMHIFALEGYLRPS